MGKDDILFFVGVIDEFDGQGGDRVLQGDFRSCDAIFAVGLVSCVIKLGIVVAVGVAHVEGRCADEGSASGRNGHRSGSVGLLHQRMGMVGLDGNDGGFGGPGGQDQAQKCGRQEEDLFHVVQMRLQFTHFFWIY